MSSQILITFWVYETRRSFSLRVYEIVGKLRREIPSTTPPPPPLKNHEIIPVGKIAKKKKKQSEGHSFCVC